MNIPRIEAGRFWTVREGLRWVLRGCTVIKQRKKKSAEEDLELGGPPSLFLLEGSRLEISLSPFLVVTPWTPPLLAPFSLTAHRPPRVLLPREAAAMDDAIWYCSPCSWDSGGTVTLEVRLIRSESPGGDDALCLVCCDRTSGERALPSSSSFPSLDASP